MAERVGFEPTNTVRCYTLSRRAPSTARPPLLKPQSAPTAGRDCSRRTPLVLRFAPDRCSFAATSKIAPAILSNPRTPFGMLLTFQACAFDRSATSPRGRKGTGGDPRDQIDRALTGLTSPGARSEVPAQARGRPRMAPATSSRWPPYWEAPACSAAERRDRCPSAPAAAARAPLWE